jgi:dipeptidyl aminopeptidase/acylaminoacyl peptidase
MGIFVKALLYFLAGSGIAGAVMGAGFATNLGGRVRKSDVASLQKLGTYVPLDLDGIDGGLIAAANERRPVIIYVHGRSANRTELTPLAKMLFDAGYNAVLWDSKSRQISYGPREIDQIRRIIAAVRNDPHVAPEKLYVIGFSLGAAMAIGAASADSEGYIHGVVADSPYANLESVASRYLTGFGIVPSPIAWPARTVTLATARALHGIEFETRNPADWAERVSCPVLLIHGKSDRRIPPRHSEQIFGRLLSQKQLWLVDDAAHTRAFRRDPAEYAARVLAFLRTGVQTGVHTGVQR